MPNKKGASTSAAKKGVLGTVKRTIKKVIPKIAKGVAKATGGVGVATTLYEFYRRDKKTLKVRREKVKSLF